MQFGSVFRLLTSLICDVDGVLTDGGLRYAASGEELKVFHARDGAALKEAKAVGLRIIVISGRKHPALERRLQDLGINDYRLGVGDKIAAAQDCGVAWDTTAAVGDDLPDVPLLQQVALSIAVADATPPLKRRADFVTTIAGGVVRWQKSLAGGFRRAASSGAWGIMANMAHITRRVLYWSVGMLPMVFAASGLAGCGSSQNADSNAGSAWPKVPEHATVYRWPAPTDSTATEGASPTDATATRLRCISVACSGSVRVPCSCVVNAFG